MLWRKVGGSIVAADACSTLLSLGELALWGWGLCLLHRWSLKPSKSDGESGRGLRTRWGQDRRRESQVGLTLVSGSLVLPAAWRANLKGVGTLGYTCFLCGPARLWQHLPAPAPALNCWPFLPLILSPCRTFSPAYGISRTVADV